MAKILHVEQWGSVDKRRYFVIALTNRTIELLDISLSQKYFVKTESIEELAKMMNYKDDEWHTWLNDAGFGLYTGLPRSQE